VDPGGRPLIAFHRANAGNFFDVYMTWSEDRQTFAPARNLTPGTDGRDDDDVASIVFHPTTALPHLIFSSTLTTSPLNTEAMHGELVP
jgi:hypothetical protein